MGRMNFIRDGRNGRWCNGRNCLRRRDSRCFRRRASCGWREKRICVWGRPPRGCAGAALLTRNRSEERRVGEEGRSRWLAYHLKKKKLSDRDSRQVSTIRL